MSSSKTGTMLRPPRIPLFSGVPLETFWGSLGEADRRASVETSVRPTTICQKTAWNLAGAALAYWEGTLSNRLHCIRVNRKKEITGQVDWAIPIHPFMLGTALEDAWPTVVITCCNEGVLKRLGRLIKRDEKFRQSGFRLLPWTGCFLQQAGGGGIGELIRKDKHSACILNGIGVEIRSHSDVMRTATVGGLIAIQDEIFGLTVAHLFSKNPIIPRSDPQTARSDLEGFEIDLDSNDCHSDISDEGCNVEFDFIDDTIEPPIEAKTQENDPIMEKLSVSEVFLQHRGSRIGTFINHPRMQFRDGVVIESPHANLDLDWALITLNANALQDEGLDLGNPIIVNLSEQTSELAPQGEVVMCCGDMLRPGFSTGVSSMICLPGSDSFTRTYSIHFPGEDGSCGAWVRHSLLSKVYGTIIGYSPIHGVTYIVPMKDILADITDKWTSREKSPLPMSINRRTLSADDEFPYEAIVLPKYRFELPFSVGQPLNILGWHDEESFFAKDSTSGKIGIISRNHIQSLRVTVKHTSIPQYNDLSVQNDFPPPPRRDLDVWRRSVSNNDSLHTMEFRPLYEDFDKSGHRMSFSVAAFSSASTRSAAPSIFSTARSSVTAPSVFSLAHSSASRSSTTTGRDSIDPPFDSSGSFTFTSVNRACDLWIQQMQLDDVVILKLNDTQIDDIARVAGTNDRKYIRNYIERRIALKTKDSLPPSNSEVSTNPKNAAYPDRLTIAWACLLECRARNCDEIKAKNHTGLPASNIKWDPDRPLQCLRKHKGVLCSRAFKEKDSWLKHLKITEPQLVWVCGVCRRAFTSYYYDHYRSHFNKDDITKDEILRSREYDIVITDPPFTRQCRFCRKIFNNWAQFHADIYAHFTKDSMTMHQWYNELDPSDDEDSDTDEQGDKTKKEMKT